MTSTADRVVALLDLLLRRWIWGVVLYIGGPVMIPTVVENALNQPLTYPARFLISIGYVFTTFGPVPAGIYIAVFTTAGTLVYAYLHHIVATWAKGLVPTPTSPQLEPAGPIPTHDTTDPKDAA